MAFSLNNQVVYMRLIFVDVVIFLVPGKTKNWIGYTFLFFIDEFMTFFVFLSLSIAYLVLAVSHEFFLEIIYVSMMACMIYDMRGVGPTPYLH